jgi:hypothetical protein
VDEMVLNPEAIYFPALNPEAIYFPAIYFPAS